MLYNCSVVYGIGPAMLPPEPYERIGFDATPRGINRVRGGYVIGAEMLHINRLPYLLLPWFCPSTFLLVAFEWCQRNTAS